MPESPSDPTTGTPVGEAGVPVVDLTALVQSLYTEADRCREAAQTAASLVDGQRRQADLLEALAGVLSGEG